MKNLNNNQVRSLVAITILTIILTTAGLASAQGRGQGMRNGQGMGPGGNGAFGPGHRMEMMALRLDLTEAQQANIQTIHENSLKAGVETRKNIMRLHNELRGEMLKDSPSEQTLLNLNEEIGQLRTEMRALRLKTRLAVREELTPEQRDQMLMMGGQGHRGGPQGRRGKGGPGFGQRGGFQNGFQNDFQNGPRFGGGMGYRFNPDYPINN